MRNVSLKEIEQELHKSQGLSMEVSFDSFNDGMFTYSGVAHGVMHEFTFKANDTLLAEMFANDIIELKEVGVLIHSIYLKNGKEMQLESQVIYRSNYQQQQHA